MSMSSVNFSSHSSARPSFLKTVYEEQVQTRLATLPADAQPLFQQTLIKTDLFYRQLVTRVQLAQDQLRKNGAAWQQTADKTYLFVNAQLQTVPEDETTPMQRAFYEGRIAKLFREIDNQGSQKLGKPLHRYCGCHILEEGVSAESQIKMKSPTLLGKPARYHIAYPTQLQSHPKLNQRSALIYSWSYGGGHDAAQSALGQRYAAAGMHVYNVQVDKELLDCDPVWNLTRKRYTTGDLIEYLMTNNWWKTIRFINWYFSGAPNPIDEEKRIRSFTQISVSRGLPDIALTCLARYVGSMEKAGARIGIPFVNMPTDLDPELFDLQKDADVKNPHFLHGIAVRDAKIDEQTTLSPHLTYEIGFPVRPAIMKKYSTAEVVAFRQKWNVADDRRVVLVLAGRDGIRNNCAEEIFDNYAAVSEENFPIHLIAICGKNEAEKQRLVAKYTEDKHITIHGFANEAEMGEFYAMAADVTRQGALVSAKGGGGTVMESIAAKAPLLVSDLNGLHWEWRNIGFVDRNKLGMVFRKKGEICQQLAALLKAEYVNPFAEVDSVQKSLDVVVKLIDSAQADVPFTKLKENALQVELRGGTAGNTGLFEEKKTL